MGQTYELVADRPPATPWPQYVRDVSARWRRLLDSDPAELEVQRFLEAHPSLVPGGEGGLDSVGGHHGAFPLALISQPDLPGLTRPIPDFLWVSKQSSVIKPVLVEIERPSKLYFRPRATVQSSELTEAIAQLAAWRGWFDNDSHRTLFYQRYGIDDAVREYHRVVPVYCLIYGRRTEFIDNPERSTHRDTMRPDWLIWKTFDSLKPHYDSRHAITVRHQEGRFVVVGVPPTLELGPENIDELLRFDGLEGAIAASEEIAPDRKEFLLERLPYWRSWAARERRGVITYGDFE